MTTITTVTTEREPEGPSDYSQELIAVACVVIALIFFLIGLRWARRRRHRHEGEHLVVDMAEPETLKDPDGDRSG